MALFSSVYKDVDSGRSPSKFKYRGESVIHGFYGVNN